MTCMEWNEYNSEIAKKWAHTQHVPIIHTNHTLTVTHTSTYVVQR